MLLPRARLEAFLREQAGPEAEGEPRLVDGPPGPREASAPLLAGLRVQVDAGPLEARAAAAAEGLMRGFLTVYLSVVALVLAAGAALVSLVWQAERLARQRSAFAAAAAHELRTPLAGLRMYAEMLAEGLGDPAGYPRYARRVADEAERLGRVVTNVLGFTHLERQSLAVSPRPGDLAAFVGELAARLGPWLEGMGALLAVELPGAPVDVPFDPDAVTQILQNLLDNAERYARDADDRTITLRISPGNAGSARISVSDRGPGVARAMAGRLFVPFSRGNQLDGPAGLGLGLSLCRALARAHGGDMFHEETPGGGATFTVSLPGAAR
jgi:signal transduction histidine kinase